MIGGATNIIGSFTNKWIDPKIYKKEGCAHTVTQSTIVAGSTVKTPPFTVNQCVWLDKVTSTKINTSCAANLVKKIYGNWGFT